MTTRTLALPAILLALSVAGAFAADKKVQMKDVPAAVQKAVQQEEAKGAKIVGLSTEVEEGKTMYEVKTTVNGHTRDLLLDATGAIVETEEATSLDAVPGPVKSALEARGKVVSVETVTKGKTVTYEAQIQKDGKRSEVAVDAAGKPIKP
jgi:uncharacterized membrane protein YkoI